MRTVVRRRLAAGAGLLSSALVAGLLVSTTGASAAGTARPNTVFNDETAARIDFTVTERDVPRGSIAEFTAPGRATFRGTVEESAPTPSTPSPPAQPTVTQRNPRVTVNLADPTYTVASPGVDGPVDPGPYAVTFLVGDNPLTPASDESQPRTVLDTCSGNCITVLTRTPPTATTASPSGLSRGSGAQTVTFSGSGFARSTLVQVLGADGKPDPQVVVAQQGLVTTDRLPRTVEVQTGAALGARDVLVTNTDDKQSVCRACLNILGTPFAGVDRTASTNTASDDRVRVVFTATGGSPFPTDARAALEYDLPSPGSSTRQGLRIDATSNTLSADRTTLTAVFDLRGAAPGQNAYLPTVTSSSNGVSTSPARFSITQPSPPVVSGVAPSRQAAGTTQAVNVSGTGFARGAVVTLSDAPTLGPAPAVITATTVEVLSSTTLRATFAVPSNAPTGPRDVVVTNTDGQRDELDDSYTIDAAAPTPTATATGSPTSTPTASATPSRSATPTATASPSRSATATATATATTSPTPTRVAPRLSLPRSTITSQEAARVDATAEPGSVAELFAYSRPRTQYVRVRRAVVGQSGAVSFSVTPSGNTRMYLRTTDVDGAGRQDSPSVVLTVRTSINLKVARTGAKTYRFTGSTLPKRPGQTVNVRYRSGSGSVVASKVRVAANGTYSVTRRFTGSGTLTFFTDTGVDINNAAGTSNAVRTTIR